MSLEELAEKVQVEPSDLVRLLFMKGIMLSMNQVLDKNTGRVVPQVSGGGKCGRKGVGAGGPSYREAGRELSNGCQGLAVVEGLQLSCPCCLTDCSPLRTPRVLPFHRFTPPPPRAAPALRWWRRRRRP